MPATTTRGAIAIAKWRNRQASDPWLRSSNAKNTSSGGPTHTGQVRNTALMHQPNTAAIPADGRSAQDVSAHHAATLKYAHTACARKASCVNAPTKCSRGSSSNITAIRANGVGNRRRRAIRKRYPAVSAAHVAITG